MNANEHDGTPRPYWTARLSADTLEERATALAEYLETLGLVGPSIIRELLARHE